MRPLNQILFFAVLAMIVFARLYAAPSAITGLSLKNIVLYTVSIVILLSYADRLPLLRDLPGAAPVAVRVSASRCSCSRRRR